MERESDFNITTLHLRGYFPSCFLGISRNLQDEPDISQKGVAVWQFSSFAMTPIHNSTSVSLSLSNQVGGVVATIFLLCVALIAITLNLQPPHSTGWQSLPSYHHHIVIITLNIQPPQINFVIHHHRFWSQLQPAELEQILA